MIDVAAISESVKANINFRETDYVKRGLLHCGECNTPKQHHFKIEEMNIDTIVWCICKCRKTEFDNERKKHLQKQSQDKIFTLRSMCFHEDDRKLMYSTFDNDDGENTFLMDKAARYFTKWKRMYEKNSGLLLWGDTGTGKTYFAACIANALIDKGIPVQVTDVTRIINDLSAFNNTNKNAYIKDLNRNKLLVIDDLGAERKSESGFAQEILYSVINARVKSEQPMIITTNLTLDEIRNPTDIMSKRIFERVTEATMPIKFDGVSRRSGIQKRKIADAKEIFAELDDDDYAY
jgi:DNA replication protein DnaC